MYFQLVWKTVLILIRWLLKPADQDLVFSKKDSTGQGLILGSAGQG